MHSFHLLLFALNTAPTVQLKNKINVLISCKINLTFAKQAKVQIALKISTNYVYRTKF